MENQPTAFHIISCHKGQVDINHTTPQSFNMLNQKNSRMPASEKSNTLMLQLSSDFMIQSMWCQQLN
jgi:hypothetical protein